MAQDAPPTIRVNGLGPGFWPFTIAMTVFNVIVGVAIAILPADWMLPGASNRAADRAQEIDFLFKFMAILSTPIFVYVTGYVLYFAWVFRRRADEPANSVGVQVHDHHGLEFWWTAIPAFMLLALAVLSVQVWYKVQFGTGTPAFAMEAIGHQFDYEYRYPGLRGSVWHTMHLPLGKPVRLHITSADVLHSWWVPEMRLKADTVPGLVQNLNFTPTREGTYDVACTEFCGVNHSKMQGKLIVESPEKFAAWIETENKKNVGGPTGGGAPAPVPPKLVAGNADKGKLMFGQKCASCHSVGPFDQKVIGPGLGHLTNDPQHPTLVTGESPTPGHIAAILKNGYNGPIGMMPNQQANGLTNEDIANLVAYLVSLK